MGVTASLLEPDVQVTPGQDVVCPLQVHNTGAVVDQFSVALLGPAASWTEVEPAVLNLFPGDSGEVQVHFHPPRTPGIPAGPAPFGIRLTSREDPKTSWVEEGTVHVRPFTEIRTALVPMTSGGRWSGRYRFEVENRGNRPLDTALVLGDLDERLRLTANRTSFMARPGSTTRIRVRVRPRRRFLRGPDRPLGFQALLLTDTGDVVGGEPGAVQQTGHDGLFVQRALVPGWLVPALAGGLALVVAAVAMWYAVLKPLVRSVAQDAVAQQTAQLTARTDEARQAAQAAAQKADKAAAQKADKAAAAVDGTTGGTARGTTGGTAEGAAGSGALTQPVDLRIQADAAPRTDGGFATFTAAGQKDRPLDITDLQLQNPSGDSGVLELRRNGTVWLRFGLDNFRDYDDHFVVPVRFNVGDALTFAVSCRNPGGRRCTPAVSVSGRTSR
jgi:hypothetical protein